ncbi:MAG: hypothetical protein IT371_21350 [Deltaproteobacteria bacterium]|nr:hypothetical protein [Deltaproteobacteria bacterium]
MPWRSAVAPGRPLQLQDVRAELHQLVRGARVAVQAQTLGRLRLRDVAHSLKAPLAEVLGGDAKVQFRIDAQQGSPVRARAQRDGSILVTLSQGMAASGYEVLFREVGQAVMLVAGRASGSGERVLRANEVAAQVRDHGSTAFRRVTLSARVSARLEKTAWGRELLALHRQEIAPRLTALPGKVKEQVSAFMDWLSPARVTARKAESTRVESRLAEERTVLRTALDQANFEAAKPEVMARAQKILPVVGGALRGAASLTEAHQLFAAMRDGIPGENYPDEFCHDRATAAAVMGANRGIRMFKVEIVTPIGQRLAEARKSGMKQEQIDKIPVPRGSLLTVSTRNHPAGLVRWTRHIAPIVEVQLGDGRRAHYVIDPSLASGPIPLKAWLALMKRPAGSQVSIFPAYQRDSGSTNTAWSVVQVAESLFRLDTLARNLEAGRQAKLQGAGGQGFSQLPVPVAAP